MERTAIEQRLDELTATYHDSPAVDALGKELKTVLANAFARGVPPEQVAYFFAQAAAGLLSAMKIKGELRPELATALVEDFSETVNKRSFQGVPMLVKPK